MSKRRLSKQQFTRIEKRQQSYHTTSDAKADSITNDGLVMARYTRHAHVEDEQGRVVRCAIRPNIDSLVAGDRVAWQQEGLHQGMILSRYPRSSVLGRPDSNGKVKPIAANISQIMIVVAPAPAISWSLLDSYLIMTEYLKIPPYIVFNKTDLPNDDIRQTLLRYYEPLGYRILFTNHRGDEDKWLHKALKNQISVFVGQSGVGKSSLIARLLPHAAARIQTQALTEHSLLGCHTTSHSELFHLPTGGDIIDSPGIRELSLWPLSDAEITHGYREFRPYSPQCKFRNCTHIQTPGCAVAQAVKNKLISLQRYENYARILASKNASLG